MMLSLPANCYHMDNPLILATQLAAKCTNLWYFSPVLNTVWHLGA